MTHDARRGESGNLFFYLFLVVVLFGSLTIAIAQSGRGSVTAIADEQTRLNATEIIDFSETVAKAVGTLRLRGTRLNELRFATSELPAVDYGAPGASPENEVFNPEGGAAVYRSPPSGALKTAGVEFAFLGGIEFEKIGTTCGTAACSDLIMLLPGINEGTCSSINRLASIDSIEETSILDTSSKFLGSMNYVSTVNEAALEGKAYGCFMYNDAVDANDVYYFYRILWAQ